ncbi:MAG TPA: phosphate ABC transporter permease PtsA, partial [Candidatus Methylomirabilis sp.]|nr:phosphate ABC transporter permease PtsA [Candidatus Methylomirabilis sp.]
MVTRRRLVNRGMSWLSFLSALLVISPLLLILGFLVYQGLSAINIDFFIHLPKPVGEPGGGVANAIVGSLIILALAVCLGLPVGILGGVYLAESRDARLPALVRFLA